MTECLPGRYRLMVVSQGNAEVVIRFGAVWLQFHDHSGVGRLSPMLEQLAVSEQTKVVAVGILRLEPDEARGVGSGGLVVAGKKGRIRRVVQKRRIGRRAAGCRFEGAESSLIV